MSKFFGSSPCETLMLEWILTSKGSGSQPTASRRYLPVAKIATTKKNHWLDTTETWSKWRWPKFKVGCMGSISIKRKKNNNKLAGISRSHTFKSTRYGYESKHLKTDWIAENKDVDSYCSFFWNITNSHP